MYKKKTSGNKRKCYEPGQHIPCEVFLDFVGGDWSPSFSSDGDECFFDDE